MCNTLQHIGLQLDNKSIGKEACTRQKQSLCGSSPHTITLYIFGTAKVAGQSLVKQRLLRMSDSIEEELRNLKEKQETIIREITQKKAEVEEMKRMVEEAQQKNIADQIEKFRSEHITYFYLLSLFVP